MTIVCDPSACVALPSQLILLPPPHILPLRRPISMRRAVQTLRLADFKKVKPCGPPRTIVAVSKLEKKAKGARRRSLLRGGTFLAAAPPPMLLPPPVAAASCTRHRWADGRLWLAAVPAQHAADCFRASQS